MGERRRITVQDRLWLEMDRPNNLMVVDSVLWTAEPLDWDGVHAVMTDRLAGRYPVFRSRAVHDLDGSWWWEEDPEFDLDNHCRVVSLDDPDDPRALQRLVAASRTEMLDRDKPLWSALWVDRYLGGSATILRTHHSIADGVRMVELAMNLFDATPEGGRILPPGVTTGSARTTPSEVVPATRPAAASIPRLAAHAGRGALSLAGRGARSVAGRVPGAVHEAARLARASVANPLGAGHGLLTETAHAAGDLRHAAQMSMQAVLPGGGVINVLAAAPSDLDTARKLVLGTRNDPTLWTGSPGRDKGVAWADPLPLHEVRAVAKAAEATINDVLVSCLAGALQRYLADRNRHCASTTFMIPVNLKPLNETLPDELGNAFALIYLELPTSEVDLAAVLETVKRRMRRIKHGHESAVTFKIQETISGFNHSVYTTSIDYFANRASGVLTNVPGPQVPVYLAGSKVEGVVGWAPVSGDQPMSLTIYSYNGSVIVGIAADTSLVPGYESIVDGFADVFASLKAATLG